MHTLLNVIKKKAVGIPALIFFAYLISGFFVVPALLTSFVPDLVQKELNCKLTVEKISLNPLTLSLEVKDFLLKDSNQADLLKFERFFANFQLASLVRWALTFDQVTLEKPSVQILMDSNGNLNLAALSQPAPPKKQDSKASAPPKIWIDQLNIIDGGIHVEDQRPQPSAKLNFDHLTATFSQVTTMAGLDGYGTLSVKTRSGAAFRWKGSLLLSPLASNGIINVSDLKLASIFGFVKNYVNTEPPGGRLNLEMVYQLGLKDNFELSLSDISATLNDFNLRLKEEKNAFVHLEQIKLEAGRYDLQSGRLALKQVNLKKGFVHLKRRKDGTLNLADLQKDSVGEPEPKTGHSDAFQTKFKLDLDRFQIKKVEVLVNDYTKAPAAQFHLKSFDLNTSVSAQADQMSLKTKISDLNLNLNHISAGFETDKKPILTVDQVVLAGGDIDLVPQRVSVAKLAVNGGGIDICRSTDGRIELFNLLTSNEPSPATPPRSSPAESTQLKKQKPWQWSVSTIDVKDINSSYSDKNFQSEKPLINLDKIHARLTNVNENSPIDFKAGFILKQGGSAEVAGKFDLARKALESDLEVYNLNLASLKPYLTQFAHVGLESGVLSTQGRLDHNVGRNPQETLFEGRIMVDKFKLLDDAAESELISWKRLKTTGLKLSLNPNELSVKDMTLVNPAGRLLIAKDGSLNFSNTIEALSAEEESKPAASTQGAATDTNAALFPLNVDRVRLSGGQLEFADNSLDPFFSTRIDQLQGSVTGISLTPKVRAKIDLKGRVDQYGISEIRGELSPSAPKEFADVGMRFKNVEMARLSPYTGKFAGRKINSGKLSMDLKYNIEKSRLVGDNQIIVEKLALGPEVESPGAASLPLDFAIALLQDANGVIDLGIPVQGNLNDPKFSYGHLIWETFRKQIYKIVSSPFRALSSLFTGSYKNIGTIRFEPGKATLPPPEQEKLAELLKALKARPQLSVTITGKYNPKKDGDVFRDLKLRKLIAGLMELELGDGEDPGPLNLYSPEVQETIEDLYEDQFGDEALEQVKENGDETPAPGVNEEDFKSEKAAQLAKICFNRLCRDQKLSAHTLADLAAERSRAILTGLSGPNGIAPSRLKIAEPEALKNNASITAVLRLAVKKNN